MLNTLCLLVCLYVGVRTCMWLQHRGYSALHFCFLYGYGETLGQYLITKGADDTLRNDEDALCYEM